jgi:ADP-ribose pyrophosphatase YjhB (NUDIX family)
LHPLFPDLYGVLRAPVPIDYFELLRYPVSPYSSSLLRARRFSGRLAGAKGGGFHWPFAEWIVNRAAAPGKKALGEDFSIFDERLCSMLKREYPERPIVGVGAVIMDEEVVLLVRRKQDPGKGQWSLPGGVVKVGESLRDAVKREILEEISIQIEIGGVIGVFDRIIHDRNKRIKYHYVLVDFWGWTVRGHPKPGSDISDVRSVPLRQLESCEISRDVKDTILAAEKMRDTGCVMRS